MPLDYFHRLRSFTRQGHADEVTCMCVGTVFEDGEVVPLMETIVVTGSKDGSVAVWELDRKLDVFRLKVFLVPDPPEERVSADVKEITTVACYLTEPVQSGEHTFYKSAYVLLTAQGGSVRLYHIVDGSSCDDAHDPLGSACADALNPLGLPERWTFDASCELICPECDHRATVHSLVLVPPRATPMPNYCFGFVSGSSDGMARLWEVYTMDQPKCQMPRKLKFIIEEAHVEAIEEGEQDDELMVARGRRYTAPDKYRMRHAKCCNVTSVSFCSWAENQSCLVTGDDHGIVKVWLYGKRPALLHVLYHNQGEPISQSVVKCARLTPQLSWTDERYLVVSAGMKVVYAWSLKQLRSQDTPSRSVTTETIPERYYIRAASIDFIEWAHFSQAAKLQQEPSAGLLMVSANPCGTARLWHIMDDRGLLTVPLWRQHSWDHKQEGNSGSLCRIVWQYRHSAKVTAVLWGISRLRAGDEAWTSRRLLTASADRSCVMWHPLGMPLRTLRSATLVEMFYPFAFMLLTCSQLMQFAFAEDYKWNRPLVRPTKALGLLASIDVIGILPPLPRSWEFDIFLASSFSALGFCLVYVLVAFWSPVVMCRKHLSEIESRAEYRREISQMRTGEGRWPMGRQHKTYWYVRHFMLLCMSLLVLGSWCLTIPIVKMAASLVDCIRVPTDLASDRGVPAYHLTLLPEWECYRGPHLPLSILAYVLVPLFCWVSLPYSLTGSAELVQRSDLFRPFTEWQRDCEWGIGSVFLGPVHSNGKNFFITTLIETITRIASPCVHILLSTQPKVQGSIMLLMHTVALLAFICFPPFVQKSTRVLLNGCKLVTLWAYICAMTSELVNDEKARVPSVMWYAGVGIMVVIGLSYFAWCSHREERAELERSQAMCFRKTIRDSNTARIFRFLRRNKVTDASDGYYLTAEDFDVVAAQRVSCR